eukprot:7123124-Pyramimonas_sp.AAC.1
MIDPRASSSLQLGTAYRRSEGRADSCVRFGDRSSRRRSAPMRTSRRSPRGRGDAHVFPTIRGWRFARSPQA